MRKKSQMSSFLIIAVIVVVAIFFLMIISSWFTHEWALAQTKRVIAPDIALGPIRTFGDACTDNALASSIAIMFSQRYEFNSNSNVKEIILENITDLLNDTFDLCTNLSSFLSEGYNFSFSQPAINVTIDVIGVSAFTSFPLQVERGSASGTISGFGAKEGTSLGMLINSSQKIIDNITTFELYNQYFIGKITDGNYTKNGLIRILTNHQYCLFNLTFVKTNESLVFTMPSLHGCSPIPTLPSGSSVGSSGSATTPETSPYSPSGGGGSSFDPWKCIDHNYPWLGANFYTPTYMTYIEPFSSDVVIESVSRCTNATHLWIHECGWSVFPQPCPVNTTCVNDACSPAPAGYIPPIPLPNTCTDSNPSGDPLLGGDINITTGYPFGNENITYHFSDYCSYTSTNLVQIHCADCGYYLGCKSFSVSSSACPTNTSCNMGKCVNTS